MKDTVSRSHARGMQRNGLVNLFCGCACLCYLMLYAPCAHASHAAGGELVYMHTGGSTYHVIFKFYRDCSGIEELPTVPLCVRSCDPFAGFLYYTMTKMAQLPGGSPNGQVVNPGCPGYPTACDMAGSALKGYREWWYETTVTLPGPCDPWTLSVAIGARNPSDNIGIDDLYIAATINNRDASANSSPYFTVKPVPYICINTSFAFNPGAVDPDGDLLAYELMQPQRRDLTSCLMPPVPVPFTSPIYNLTDNPIGTGNTFRLDRSTGQMDFTPNALQTGTLTLLVREYRNGVEIGSVMRDVQITVLSCNAPVPAFRIDSASVRGGIYTDSAVEVCAGVALDFCFTLQSPVDSAVLVATDNAATTLPGGNVTYHGLLTDSVAGCVRWTPGITDAGLRILSVTVRDSLCTPPGILVSRTYAVPIRVFPPPVITGDTVVCAGDSTRLRVSGGGTAITWSVLSGDPLSLSCTDCNTPWIKPSQTTTYRVQGCDADTFTVHVFRRPDIDAGPDRTRCRTDSVQLSVDVMPPGQYVYRWSPSAYLDSDTIQRPVTHAPASTAYAVTVASRDAPGCFATDTVEVRVAAPPSFDADTAVCEGDTVRFLNTSAGDFTGWRWDFGDGATDTVASPVHRFPGPGRYTVMLTGYPCLDTVYRIIVAGPLSYVSFRMDTNRICAGQNISFYPDHNGDAHTLLWHFGDGTDTVANRSPVHAFDRPGTFAVSLTGEFSSCPDTSFADTVFVFPFPVVNLGPDTSLCPGNGIVLASSASRPPDAVVRWSNGEADDHIFVQQPGTYALTVTSAYHCATTDSITVSPSCYLDIPNVFTPNADGINDYFFPRQLQSGGLVRFNMQVFNRWGTCIFATDKTDGRGWDGRYNNADQPQGVYVYRVEAAFVNGVEERRQGNVTLMR